ncbi:hypothetical protein [Pseudomonas granadensis]|uniref:hypothetical protein n=1 Tax=Pseudomonas granadensis TaxID=1421430 RepID=UPI00087CD2F2|nr:hypothetical protein [Pseudomonas granadensis]SDT63257.1 hypothetical protein SAMN05216579_5076 [Pseudomonas granadensis]
MTGSSNEKSMADINAATGKLSVKVNAAEKTLEAFQLIEIGESLAFMFRDASFENVVSTKFPSEKLGQELEYDKNDLSVNVSYNVAGKPVSWEGGKIKVAAKAGGGYEGTLQAVGSAPGLSWTLSEGSFEITN